MKAKAALEGSLLANAVLNQQLQLEASFLQQQSLRHQAACSDLSSQLTHIQSQLLVRSAEVNRQRRQGPVPGKLLELRRREERLERENETLREQAKSTSEAITLHAEIAQTKELQRLYLEKLKEHWPGEEKDAGKGVQADLQTASQERDYFRDKVIPVLRQTIDLFEQHKANLIGEISELQESIPMKLPVPSLSPLEAAVRALGLSPRVGTQQKASASRSSKTSKASVYSPSFLRTRRHRLKVKSRREIPPSQTITETDEFAESFPEEDELVPSE